MREADIREPAPGGAHALQPDCSQSIASALPALFAYGAPGDMERGADVLTSGSPASRHVTEGGPAEGRVLGGGNGANDRTCHRIASLLGTPCHYGEAWASQARSWKNRRSKACCGLGPGSHCKSGGLLPTPPDTTSKFPSAGAEAFKRSRRETDCPLVHVVRVCP